MKHPVHGVALAYANVGGPWGSIVAHWFVDGSTAPVCHPHVAGSPGHLFTDPNASRCVKCQETIIDAWWSVAPFGAQHQWVVDVGAHKGAAEGVAPSEEDAAKQAIAAIERLLAPDAPVVITRGTKSEALRVVREKRAAERAKKIGEGSDARPVENLYRWRETIDLGDITGLSFEEFMRSQRGRGWKWTCEVARVLRKTKRRVFIENVKHSYATGGGVFVSRTYSLDRQELERTGRVRSGWTTDPNPPRGANTCTKPGWADVLGVSSTCSLAEAKRAFRKAAKAAHPDSGGTAEAFQRVKQAYDAAALELGGAA